jgi:hypothetical protein
LALFDVRLLGGGLGDVVLAALRRLVEHAVVAAAVAAVGPLDVDAPAARFDETYKFVTVGDVVYGNLSIFSTVALENAMKCNGEKVVNFD